MIIYSYKEGEEEQVIERARAVLELGGVIAYPTESFYALGAQAADERAVEKLFRIKRRNMDKPLPLIVGDMDTLAAIVKDVPVQAKRLMDRYWPGPLSIILEARNNLPALLTGGTGRVAVRIPGDSAALRLARGLKTPITATSANPSGEPPAEDCDTLVRYFDNRIDVIIDAGRVPGGKPSTIVDASAEPFRIVRKGSMSPRL